jgi:ABC-2 type transport system permease protein
MKSFVQETQSQLVRWLLHLKREPFSLAFNLLQPVILLIFMGGAFHRVLEDLVAGGDYRAYLLPGVIALTVFGNSMGGGIPLLFDKERGLLQRLLSTPITRASILVSRFLAVNINAMVQCLIILALGFLFGVRVATGVGGVAALLMFGLLLGFGFTVVSLILAFLGLTTLPLTFLSTAFVPIDALPTWMKALAWVNPMTYAIDGMRTLVLLDWDAPILLRSALVLLVFDILLFWIGGRILRRQLA